MADGDNRDGVPAFGNLIDDDVVADYEAPQGWINSLEKRTSEVRVISECLDPIEKILDNSSGRRRIVFGDEVKEFGDSVQSRLGPDDPVAH